MDILEVAPSSRAIQPIHAPRNLAGGVRESLKHSGHLAASRRRWAQSINREKGECTCAARRIFNVLMMLVGPDHTRGRNDAT